MALLPGLWEMHAHFTQVEWGPIYLAAGVTTARDCANEFEFITAARDAIASSRGLGPRLLPAGFIDGEGPRSIGVDTATTPEQALALIRRYADAGFPQIKIYSSLKPELVATIAREAHRRGMSVTGHIPDRDGPVTAPSRPAWTRSTTSPMSPGHLRRSEHRRRSQKRSDPIDYAAHGPRDRSRHGPGQADDPVPQGAWDGDRPDAGDLRAARSAPGRSRAGAGPRRGRPGAEPARSTRWASHPTWSGTPKPSSKQYLRGSGSPPQGGRADRRGDRPGGPRPQPAPGAGALCPGGDDAAWRRSGRPRSCRPAR